MNHVIHELIEDHYNDSLILERIDQVNQIVSLFDNPNGKRYGIKKNGKKFEIRVWNISLERWMFLEACNNIYLAEAIYNDLNNEI